MTDDESKKPTVQPHSLAAEESVIGGVLVHPRKLVEVVPLLRTADDFYHPALRAIYEAMLELDAAGKPVDALTVVEQMRASGTFEKLKAFDGDGYLSDLMAKVVTVENLAFHAGIVRSKARRRRMGETFRELAAATLAESSDEEYAQQAEQTLLTLMADTSSDDAIVPARKVLHDWSEDFNARVKRKKAGGSAIAGVSTGYVRLNGMLSGLRAGACYVIAARAKMGKTALVSNIVQRSAKLGVAWLDFSLEMSNLDLAQRLVASEARIDGQRLSQGDIEGIEQWQRITGAVGRLVDLPLWFSDNPTLTIARIRALARRWRLGPAAKYEHVGVVVDYMQLIEVAQKKGYRSREQDVSEISRGCKLLARELKCPVIALSQLNRESDRRNDHRPIMSDLRESGAIEQDADAVIFVYRDSVYHNSDECHEPSCERCAKKDVAEIIIGLQRQGPTGTIEMLWQGAYQRFEELDTRR